MFIVAVKDRALDAYMTPFFVPAIGLAIRSFQDEINRADSPMHAHPEDYDLYHLGSFDERDGMLGGGVPRQIAIGKDQLRATS